MKHKPKNEKNHGLKEFDDMLFSNPMCCVENCLFNIVHQCTNKPYDIQPIHVKTYGRTYWSGVYCKKAILKCE